MRDEYTGHCGTGGLQLHSIGELYPYTVIAVGGGESPLQWAAFDTRSGSTGELRATYKEAEIDVYSAKVRNMMHS